MAQGYIVLNYGPPRSHNNKNTQDIKIVARPGVNPTSKCILTGNRKEKFGKEPLPDALIMDNLETSLTTTVDKTQGNGSGSILKRFIEPRASTIFDHLVYYLDGPGPPIAISGPHEEIFKSDFRIWIGGIFFRWLMQTNQNAKSMESLRTRTA